MTVELVIEIAKQIFTLGSLALAGGVITSFFTELLKYDFIKVPASRYPKVTAAVIAFIISAAAVLSLQQFVFDTWISWVIVGGATLFSAVKSYDWVLKGIYEKLLHKDS